MKGIAAALTAFSLVAASVAPAFATVEQDRAAVIAAMDMRIDELQAEVAAIQATLPSLSRGQRMQAEKEITLLQTRIMQLLSLQRIVPRYNERRLAQLAEHYGLVVSWS